MKNILFLIFCIVLLSSAPLSGQTEDYKNNREFKETWRLAESDKSWKDRYADYRLANNIAGNQCEECISRAMFIAYNSRHFDFAQEAAEILMNMPTASKLGRATAATLVGRSILQDDLENAGQNEFLKAEPYFRKGIALDPDYGKSYYELGRALVALRNTDESKTMFEKAAHISNLPDLYRARAKMFTEHPDWANLKMLPVLSMRTTEDEKITNESTLGKVVLFCFDSPSVYGYSFKSAPYPDLEKLHESLKNEPFQMVSVLTSPHESDGLKALKKHPLPWPVVLDLKLHWKSILDVHGSPSYLIVDMRGAIVTKQHAKPEELEQYLKQVIDMNKKVLGDSLAHVQK